MKKRSILLFILAFLLAGFSSLLSQAEKKAPVSASGEDQKQLKAERASYQPEGRRDPFQDLLAGREVKEKTPGGAPPLLSIDDVNLIGIVQENLKYTAIVKGPSGFPYFFKEGDKLADGFVLSISEIQAVFRKTTDKGIPLYRPKDVIKEIYPEER